MSPKESSLSLHRPVDCRKTQHFLIALKSNTNPDALLCAYKQGYLPDWMIRLELVILSLTFLVTSKWYLYECDISQSFLQINQIMSLWKETQQRTMAVLIRGWISHANHLKPIHQSITICSLGMKKVLV